MRRLIVFNHVSLDGYIADRDGDMRWAHRPAGDAEWDEFAAARARGGGGLIFGRTTYQLMASFWPTPEARAAFPELAERMNTIPKLVFSRTLEKLDWSNARLAERDLASEILTWKEAPGDDLAILGSGSIVAQASDARLVDEYQVVVNPLVVGKGTTMFGTIASNLYLELTSSRVFRNGNVVLHYRPRHVTVGAT